MKVFLHPPRSLPLWFMWWLLLYPAALLHAGHGFVTAFGDIEWLPDPGRTPDSAWYALENVKEKSQLFLARDPETKLQLCLSFAKKKLAELEAMIKSNQSQAAQTAVVWYQTYLAQAKAVLDEQAASPQKEALAERAATALLEQQYILATIYPDLPFRTRQIVLTTAAAAGAQYQEVVKLLPAKKKGAFFFKEEEVRWSLQMAARADEEEESQAEAGQQ